MMVAEPDELEIQGELKGAREQLKAARISLQKGLIRPAVSNAYYAIFHAARAALWSKGKRQKLIRVSQDYFISIS